MSDRDDVPPWQRAGGQYGGSNDDQGGSDWYGSRDDDRYGSRDDRQFHRPGNRSDNRYDDQYGSGDDDRYDPRYDDRYDDRSGRRVDSYGAPPRRASRSAEDVWGRDPDFAAGARPARPAPRRRVTPLVLTGRIAAGLVGAIAMIASGFTWYAYKDLTSGMHTSDISSVAKPGDPGYVAPHLGGDVNLLLIGLDSRKDMNGNDLPKDFVEGQLHAGSSDIGGYNTNVLIFMHIPANNGQVTAFSIERDDYVEEPGGDSKWGRVPDLGKHKIKEAYGRAKEWAERQIKATGEKDKAKIEAESREVGRESTIRAVQLLTGEHVDHIAEVNLLGFYDIAKAVGPIEVCLNHDVDDPIEDGAGTGLKLSAGHHELDAEQSLQFVRQRFHLLNGDLDRNKRQQAFMSAVIHKLKGEGIIGDLGKMQSLFDVVKKDLVIDNGWDVLDFAVKAQNLTGGNAVFHELPITGQPVLPDDGSVNTVDPVQIKQIVTSAFDNDAAVAPSDTPSTAQPTGAPAPSSTAPPPNAVIDIYNATGTKGLAGTAAALLTTGGVPVDKTGNAPNQAKTTVLYGSGGEAAAKYYAKKLGITATPTQSARLQPDHVAIYLGADWTAPGSQNKSPSSDSSSTSGTAPSAPPPTATDGAINMGDGITCVN